VIVGKGGYKQEEEEDDRDEDTEDQRMQMIIEETTNPGYVPRQRDSNYSQGGYSSHMHQQ
jgi:hypothetical protein